MALIYILDPTARILSYGYFRCPVCGKEFYGGGEALHENGCSIKDYDGLEYHYTQKELDTFAKSVWEKGINANMPLSPAGLRDWLVCEYLKEGKISFSELRLITLAHTTKIVNGDEKYRYLIDSDEQRLSELKEKAC